MGQYRLYFLDRGSGHIATSREFHADDDAAAIQLASELRQGDAAELWSRDRKVKRWEAD